MSFIELLRLRIRANKYRRRSDPGGIRFLLETLQAGQTAFDIGAHKGGYAYWMLHRVGKQGRVYAFEPQKTLFDYLVQLKNNLGWQHFIVEHLALSDRIGTADLRIPLKHTKSSSPGASIFKTAFEEDNLRIETVNVTTLDAYCQQHAVVPHLLKIDVEGNELAVLQGAEQTLRSAHPAILIECEARHIGVEQMRKTFAYLEQMGYRGYFIERLDFRPLAEFDVGKHQTEGRKPYCNNFIFQYPV